MNCFPSELLLEFIIIPGYRLLKISSGLLDIFISCGLYSGVATTSMISLSHRQRGCYYSMATKQEWHLIEQFMVIRNVSFIWQKQL